MSLSELAIDRFNRAAPELTKYIKSFRDMSDEVSDDVGVQLGVFVLANGGSQFFVPIVAKAGTIFPVDLIYFAEDRVFLPLTKKTIEQVINTSTSSFGKNMDTPQFAVKNPDLHELVVPPKTGKFMYASSSRLVEFVHLLPDALRGRLADALEDSEVNLSLRDLTDMRSIISVLKERNVLEAQIEAETPQVVTDGEGFTDEVIASILGKGYAVLNPPASPVSAVMVESDGGHSFSYLSLLEEGKAFNAITRFGDEIELAVLPMLRDKARTAERETGRGKRDANTAQFLLMARGGLIKDIDMYGYGCGGNGSTGSGRATPLLNRIVVKQQEVDYHGILDSVKSYPVEQLNGYTLDNPIVICTPRGFIGPFSHNIECVGDHIILPGVVFHDSYPAAGYWNDNVWMFGKGCTFFPVKIERTDATSAFCTDINVAQMRNEMRIQSLLPVKTEVSYSPSQGGYAVNRVPVGGAAGVMKALVVDRGMDVDASEGFLKAARESMSNVIHIMSSETLNKQAAESTKRTPIAEYGDKLPPSESGTGTKADRERGSTLKSNISNAAKVKDSQVVEATIMSEILQDQDMNDTIEEYLPDIKSAVDKLGRVLLLARIHSAKLNDDMDSEGVSDLITSIRNSFKMLGENYINLEQMAHNG